MDALNQPVDERVVLMGHQVAARDAVLDRWTDPGVLGSVHRDVVVMPTGSGKTVLAASLVAEHLVSSRGVVGEHRVLVVAPTKEVLGQWATRLAGELGAGVDAFGMAFGDQARDGGAWGRQVVFTTYDSFRGRAFSEQVSRFDTVIFDEAHHLPAPKNRRAFDVACVNTRFVLAVTATPQRSDERSLFTTLGVEAATFVYGIEDAIADEVLADVDYQIFTNVFSDEWRERVLVPLQAGQSVDADVESEFALDDTEVLLKILEHTYPSDASFAPTLVFAESVKDAKRIAGELGDGFRAVWGNSPSRDRDVAAFHRGEIAGLVSFNVLNEGIDLPEVKVVASLRNTESPVVYLQQIGRGLRRTASKPRVAVLDFTNSIERVAMARTLVEAVARSREERNPDAPTVQTSLRVNGVPLGEGRTINFDEILEVVKMQTLNAKTLEEAKAGLHAWAQLPVDTQLPVDKRGLGLSVEALATWRPTYADLDAASLAGYSWSSNTWVKNTGKCGIAGVHKKLGLPAQEKLAKPKTLEEAKARLHAWAQVSVDKGGLGLSVEALATWRPTAADLDAASKARNSWSSNTWLRKTGKCGIAGVHKALEIDMQTLKAKRLEEEKARLHAWAQLPVDKRGLGLSVEALATWRPTQAHLYAASKAGYSWSHPTWVKNTGNCGMAGVHKALGLPAQEKLATLDDAKAGLFAWAQLPVDTQLPVGKRGLGLSVEALATWRPTYRDLNAASKAGYSWSSKTWVRNTGDCGLAGVHEALEKLRASEVVEAGVAGSVTRRAVKVPAKAVVSGEVGEFGVLDAAALDELVARAPKLGAWVSSPGAPSVASGGEASVEQRERGAKAVQVGRAGEIAVMRLLRRVGEVHDVHALPCGFDAVFSVDGSDFFVEVKTTKNLKSTHTLTQNENAARHSYKHWRCVVVFLDAQNQPQALRTFGHNLEKFEPGLGDLRRVLSSACLEDAERALLGGEARVEGWNVTLAAPATEHVATPEVAPRPDSSEVVDYAAVFRQAMSRPPDHGIGSFTR